MWRTGRADVADDACRERTGGRALTRAVRADERTDGRGGKAADSRADGGGKGADSRADRVDGAHGARMGPWTGPMGPMGPMGPNGVRTVEWAEEVRTGGRAVRQTGGLRGRGLHCADGGSGRRTGRADWAVGAERAAVGRTGGQAYWQSAG